MNQRENGCEQCALSKTLSTPQELPVLVWRCRFKVLMNVLLTAVQRDEKKQPQCPDHFLYDYRIDLEHGGQRCISWNTAQKEKARLCQRAPVVQPHPFLFILSVVALAFTVCLAAMTWICCLAAAELPTAVLFYPVTTIPKVHVEVISIIVSRGKMAGLDVDHQTKLYVNHEGPKMIYLNPAVVQSASASFSGILPFRHLSVYLLYRLEFVSAHPGVDYFIHVSLHEYSRDVHGCDGTSFFCVDCQRRIG